MQRTTLPIVKGGLKRRLRQTSGVIDLASIMVGVIIVGILSTGIVATTFALVPFSQDAAAEQALDSVRTAEGAAYVSGQPNRYLNMDGLVASEWVQASSRVGVETDADGTCFAAMSHSETGNQFWTDNTTSEILPYVDGTSTSPCADLAAMSGSLTSANPGGTSGNVALASPASIITVTAGNSHSLALDSDGNLLTWGLDSQGQLGNGATTGNVTVPTKVAAGQTFTQIASGPVHSLALDAAGSLWTWGDDEFGQLGNGATTVDVSVPTKVAAGQTFTQIATGYRHSLALDAAGNLWTWGWDDNGQLGNGATTVNVTVPTKVAAGQTFTQIAAGNRHILALDAAGNLWTWGNDGSGQLGNGATTGNVTVPKRVAVGQSFTKIAAGAAHSLALDAAGNLWSWGYDYYGQLGNGATTGNVTVPTKVAAGQTFTQITAGNDSFYSLALDAAGNLLTWGYDNQGQLGNGATTGNVTVPTKVAAGQTFTQIASGVYHSLALDADGNLWTWGYDSDGQLGNGATTGNVTAPTKVAWK